MATLTLVFMAGLTWMALTKTMSLWTFIAGMGMGVVVWRVEHLRSRQPFSPKRAAGLLWAGLGLLGAFLSEIVAANLQQLVIVSSLRIELQPRWVLMRTELRSPAMRALLGLLISMIPGSVCCEELEEADGGFSIGIHALSARDDEEVVTRIRQRLEAPLLKMESL